MTQHLKVLTAIAVLLCLASTGEAQTSNLSADETAAYINTTLQKYPTLEFLGSGCPGLHQVVSISSDRRSVIIQQNFGQSAAGTCSDIQTLTAPIFSLKRHGIGGWTRQGQHTSFLLDCTNRVDCFTRRSETRWFPQAENDWLLQITAPDEVSNQLTRAIEHLLDALLLEATARMESKDPFTKPLR